jgi:SAM-dependent methyltransferase
MTSDDQAADVRGLYRIRFSAEEQRAKARIWQELCSGFFDRFIAADATVLDLACGYGEFINAVSCANRIAVDLNPDARDFLRPDVTFHNRSCADLDVVEDESVDVAFESNLFEHLASREDLQHVVGQVHRKLKPGGRFILMQPNIRYVGGAYWDFFDHVLPLTERSCAEVLLNSGFRLHTVLPRFLPYTTKSRLPQHPLLVRWYLRLPLLWKVLGKQFVIVAEKEGGGPR